MNLQKEIDAIIKEEVMRDCSPGAFDFDTYNAAKRIELLFLTKLREEKEKEFTRLFDLKTFHDSIYLHNTVNVIREECIEITNQIKELGGEG